MRLAFWKIIVVTIVKNKTVHAKVATDNNFVSKLQSLATHYHVSDNFIRNTDLASSRLAGRCYLFLGKDSLVYGNIYVFIILISVHIYM